MIDLQAPHHDQREGDRRHPDYLVGREAEMERLDTFLDVARTDGGALLVTGEPGVGKSELLDIASRQAAVADSRILRAAGVEFEAGVSFSGLNQVFLPLLNELPKIPAVHREALNVALGFGEGTPPNRLVVSNAALVLLRETAAARPLLVILDDLPWLDRASAGVLSFVARRLAGSRVGMIGASRTGENDFFDHAGLPSLVIEPLDERASRQLLDTRFPELGSAIRERILTEAQGNPLALLELPIALGRGGRASSDALRSTLPLGRRLQALFGSRTTALPPRTRQLLLRMALDGTGDVRVLETGAGSSAGFRDLTPAEEARLAYMDETAHRLAFRHPLIRSTVVELSNAEERRAAHRALADAWADQPERRAWHLAEASVEPDEDVAAELEAAASGILARGDAVGCVKALTRASALSPGAADRRRRLAVAAYVGADVAGDLSNASQILAELRRGDAAVEGSLQAAVAASVFLLQGDGDVATAHRLLVGALEGHHASGEALDPMVAEALYSLMMVCSYGGSDELWEPFEAALARSDGIPVALDLSSKTFADPARSGEAIEGLEAAVSALANEADPTHIIRIGIAATNVDRLEGCRAALWRVVDDARHDGAVASGIIAMIVLARDDLEAGRWDAAEDLVAEAIQVSDAHGYQATIWPSRYVQAVIAAARGDDDRAEELSNEIIQWTAPRGMRVGKEFASRIRGLVALGHGDFEAAFQEASEISPPGVLARHVPQALRVLMDLVESGIRTGRGAEAAAHVAAMREANLAALSPRLALVAGGCAAMAAPDDTALALFRDTLALPGIEHWQFDLARVRLAYGERLRRRRAMVEARAQLNAALETFERLRARPWMDRASTELRATGQTKPRAGDNVLDRLTPQEFEIAALAASGLTNKQIGERLFLSHRTVGGHLHRAFPKLGVATRAGLRDALGSLPAEQLPRN